MKTHISNLLSKFIHKMLKIPMSHSLEDLFISSCHFFWHVTETLFFDCLFIWLIFFFSLFFFRTPVKLTCSSSQYPILICKIRKLIKISNFFFITSKILLVREHLKSWRRQIRQKLQDFENEQCTCFWILSSLLVFSFSLISFPF